MDQDISVVRTCFWGVVLIEDSDNEESAEGDGLVWTTPTQIAVGAVNSRTCLDDADAEVRVIVRVRDTALPTAAHDHVIEIPTGVLTVGDAHERFEVALTPGPWRAQIEVDHPDWPSRIEVHLSPAS